VFPTILFSQTEKKEHFIIHANGADTNVIKYEEALVAYSQMDVFRFYDKRRVIQFVNSSITVELYSAKELLEKYGKEIPPHTIMPNQEYKEINFDLSMDGKAVKPQLK